MTAVGDSWKKQLAPSRNSWSFWSQWPSWAAFQSDWLGLVIVLLVELHPRFEAFGCLFGSIFELLSSSLCVSSISNLQLHWTKFAFQIVQCAFHPFNHQRSHRPANGLIRPLLVLRRMPRRTQVLLYFELTANMRQSLKYSSAKKIWWRQRKTGQGFSRNLVLIRFWLHLQKMWFFFKVVSDDYSRERLDYVWSQSCH